MMVLTQTRRQQLATAVVLLIAIASYMFVSPAKLVYCMRDAVAVPGSPIKSDVPTALPIPGEPLKSSIPELAKEYSAAFKKSCPQIAGDEQMCKNLAFLYRNKHISASLSPASFATATMLVRQKSDRYVTVFLSEEGKVLFEGLEDHFHDRAWQGVNRKVAQVVSSVLGAYETVK